MGSPKAALEWHGSTLLRRVTGIVARSVDGPVVVVRAPGQELPDLDPAIELVADAREGRGPLQGLAAGLAAIGGRAEVAYVSSTDLPFCTRRSSDAFWGRSATKSMLSCLRSAVTASPWPPHIGPACSTPSRS
jgi:molybdopterin-guanine dinucleotide biosynthesis protein A